MENVRAIWSVTKYVQVLIVDGNLSSGCGKLNLVREGPFLSIINVKMS